ncbi:MAG: WD40 repeat domain-containing protein [Deltaproteobacteria bacterium]|nr:WD40 repeat domain-containing protein [Deltaproteobacteria bacterium]
MREIVFNTVFLLALLGACPNAFGQKLAAVPWEVTEAIAADQFKAKLRIENDSGAILHASLGPQQRLLTLVMADSTVRLWDLNAGVQRAVIPAVGEAPSVATPISDTAIVLGDRRGRVFIVDLEAGASPRLLGTHGDAVEAVAISRDGKTLVTADADGQAIAWSLEAGKSLAVFEEHRASIRAITISNDATTVATGDNDGSVILWSPDSGRNIATLARAPGTVLALRFLDDDASVVVASRRGSVETIEISSGERLRTLEVPRRGLTGLAISRSGDRVAIGYENGGLHVYELAGDQASRELRDDDGAVGPLVFLPGSRHLLSTGRRGIARIWNLETGDVLLRIISTKNGWTVLGRQGRFDGSEQGIDNVIWEANEEGFALDQFSEEYFEPGLLASYLRDESEFAIQDPVSIEDGITLPPRVTIVSLEPTADGKLIVAVTAENRGGGIEAIRLYHNGKLVAPTSLVEQRDVRQASQHIRAAGFALDPVPGPNSFKAISTGTLGIESESQRITKIRPRPYTSQPWV